MNTNKKLIAILALAACSATMAQCQTKDAVNVLTLSLTAYEQGDTVMRGAVNTVKLNRIRVSTKDIIQAVGEVKEIAFSRGAAIILLRRDVGGEGENAQLIIRDPGRPDCDLSEYLNFDSTEGFETGTINEQTGLHRFLRLYIGTLNFNISDIVSFSISGLTTERTSSMLINREAVGSKIDSLMAKVAGEGSAEAPFLVEGLLRLGPTRLVASQVVD